MRRASLLCAAFALFAAPTWAEVTPTPGSGDPHIQSIAYDPAEVVALRVAGGYAVTVRFSPDERIETVTLGDAGSWQAAVNKRADNLVVKPIGPGLPTNLTVITDQRSYTFALYLAAFGAALQPYLVTFTYPFAAPGPSAPPASATSQYQLKGDRTLWPLNISDDGQFTALRWAEDVTLPAVYRQDARGNLALVNGAMRDGSYVIEGVADRLVFVSGKARATALRLAAGSPR
ncbi:MAG: TrbG/VirB9 family P-type conjugative transfer protein [Novosphingobium sp.]